MLTGIAAAREYQAMAETSTSGTYNRLEGDPPGKESQLGLISKNPN